MTPVWVPNLNSARKPHLAMECSGMKPRMQRIFKHLQHSRKINENYVT